MALQDTSGGQRSKTLIGQSVNFGSAATLTGLDSATIDVAGGGFVAKKGDFVQVARADGTAHTSGTHVTGRVSANDTVILTFHNFTADAIDPAAVTYNIRVTSANPL